jgi:hypothetical protein
MRLRTTALALCLFVAAISAASYYFRRSAFVPYPDYPPLSVLRAPSDTDLRILAFVLADAARTAPLGLPPPLDGGVRELMSQGRLSELRQYCYVRLLLRSIAPTVSPPRGASTSDQAVANMLRRNRERGEVELPPLLLSPDLAFVWQVQRQRPPKDVVGTLEFALPGYSESVAAVFVRESFSSDLRYGRDNLYLLRRASDGWVVLRHDASPW